MCVCFCVCFLFCYVVLSVLSSVAVISLRKIELVILLNYLSANSLCLFLMVSWVGLQNVIVVFPGHTHFFEK